MVTLATQGIGYGLLLSFAVVALATGDIRLSLLTTFSIACSVYGHFDIVLDHFPHSFKLYNTLHAPCAVIHGVPMLIVR